MKKSKQLQIKKLSVTLNINTKYEGKTLGKIYEEQKNNFIITYSTWVKSGYFSAGYEERRPDLGELEWNNKYPNGFNSWLVKKWQLGIMAHLDAFNKINELIDAVNKLTKEKEEELGLLNPPKSA